MSKNVLIDKLAVIGVGLIGGSLARALRKAGQCNQVSGYGRDRQNLQTALELGVIDDYSDDLAEVVADADVIVLATPLKTMEPLLQSLAVLTGPDAIITDVGSAKGSVVNTARAVLGNKLRNFIPGHPIAGTEKSGVEASFAELFVKHMVILTPLQENNPAAIDRVTRMWEVCGAYIVSLSVEQHDQILAATSHLPHVLAYALVDCLANMDADDEIFRFAAGGFRDFTRIASSSPEMWADICVSNRNKLLDVIEQFRQQLALITTHINNNDREQLIETFTRVKQTRDNFLQQQKSRQD
jgi:prephenate dehydrogenase